MTKRAVCLSNLAQQAKGLYRSASDNNNNMSDQSNEFKGNLIWDVTDTQAKMMFGENINPEFFQCPSNPIQGSEELVNGRSMWNYGRDFEGRSYHITGYIFLYKRADAPVSGGALIDSEWVSFIAKVSDPDSQVLVGDIVGKRGGGPFDNMSGGWYEPHTTSHYGELKAGVDGGSAAFVDGHAKWRNFEKLALKRHGIASFKWWF